MWSRSWSGAFRYGSSALLPAGRRDQGVQAERGFAGTRNETKLTAADISSSIWAEAPWSAPRGWPLSPAKQGRAESAASCALARGIVTYAEHGISNIMPVSYTHLRAHETVLDL